MSQTSLTESEKSDKTKTEILELITEKDFVNIGVVYESAPPPKGMN
jgi:hypothetical protein